MVFVGEEKKLHPLERSWLAADKHSHAAGHALVALLNRPQQPLQVCRAERVD